MGLFSSAITPFQDTLTNPFLSLEQSANFLELPTFPETDLALPDELSEYAATFPSSAKIILSYSDFYTDKFIEPDQERRLFLAELIKALALPKGSIFFWPCSLPSNGQITFSEHLLFYCFQNFTFDHFVFFGNELKIDNQHLTIPSLNFTTNFSLMVFPPFFTSKSYLNQIIFLISKNLKAE